MWVGGLGSLVAGGKAGRSDDRLGQGPQEVIWGLGEGLGAWRVVGTGGSGPTGVEQVKRPRHGRKGPSKLQSRPRPTVATAPCRSSCAHVLYRLPGRRQHQLGPPVRHTHVHMCMGLGAVRGQQRTLKGACSNGDVDRTQQAAAGSWLLALRRRRRGDRQMSPAGHLCTSSGCSGRRPWLPACCVRLATPAV